MNDPRTPEFVAEAVAIMKRLQNDYYTETHVRRMERTRFVVSAREYGILRDNFRVEQMLNPERWVLTEPTGKLMFMGIEVIAS